MKLRPVLLVLILLSGFYYVTTHSASTGSVSPWLHSTASSADAKTSSVNGPLGAFDLTVASAAPAYDTEEQQNIAVYKKALP